MTPSWPNDHGEGGDAHSTSCHAPSSNRNCRFASTSRSDRLYPQASVVHTWSIPHGGCSERAKIGCTSLARALRSTLVGALADRIRDMPLPFGLHPI